MANAKCCDRCGAFYKEVEEKDQVGFILVDTSLVDMPRMSRGKTVDLCPMCQKVLDGFMKTDKENEETGCKTCVNGPVPCCHTCRSEAECPHK